MGYTTKGMCKSKVCMCLVIIQPIIAINNSCCAAVIIPPWLAWLHHRAHLFFGFMGDPAGQLKALAKSGELDAAPITLDES